MKKMEVWHVLEPNFGMGGHPPFDDTHYAKVAVVDGDDEELAFQLTNHIDKAWWENPGVTKIREARSTSVGDVVVMPDGRKLRVEFAGFKAI